MLGVRWAMSQADQIVMVRRHILQGEKHLASQRDVIRRLGEIGADTSFAEDLLEEFETTQAEHRAHLARLLAG